MPNFDFDLIVYTFFYKQMLSCLAVRLKFAERILLAPEALKSTK